jgi:hypothetical protein
MARPKAQTSTRTSKATRKSAPAPAKVKASAKAKVPAKVKAAKPKPKPKPAKAKGLPAAAKARPAAKPRAAAAAASQPAVRRLRAKVVAAPLPSSSAGWPDLGEQRFLFPRNYEVNRVRLVVRDPEWLFAYWDVNPRAFDGIRREMGERAMALSRLTLKVADPEGGPAQIILLPYGARSWYVRIDPGHTRYFAELGITLPSGQFRSLAQSNVVALPRVGPSPDPARRSLAFRDAWAAEGDLATGVGDAPSSAASDWIDPGTSIRPGPAPRDSGGASDSLSAEMAGRRGEPRGGASDLYRR